MERRRATRFPLALPIVVSAPGSEQGFFAGMTFDISSKGVRFGTDVPFQVGDDIRCAVSLQRGAGCHRPVDLHCVGEIVRSEELPEASGGRYSIAVSLRKCDFKYPAGTSRGTSAS